MKCYLKCRRIPNCKLIFFVSRNQGDQCHQLAAKLRQQYPEIDTPTMVEAAQYVKEKQQDKAIEVLEVNYQ